jgi:hypothetical protein
VIVSFDDSFPPLLEVGFPAAIGCDGNYLVERCPAQVLVEKPML